MKYEAFNIDKLINEIEEEQEEMGKFYKGEITLKTKRPKSIKCPISYKQDTKKEFMLD